jgi:2-oxo-4-hydroxy-4-carboxy-5-ureidoimidazoline decarboxylase
MNRSFPQPPSSLSRDEFIALFGGVYEHSSHYAEAVWPVVRKGGLDTPAALANALKAAVEESGPEAQLALIRAHPDLADRLRAAPLTAQSSSEQAGAGLDACTPEELTEFQHLNSRYKEKFAFPFIKAVRGFNRQQILDEFRKRVANDPQSEFATALNEIHKIARLRLLDLSRDQSTV